MSDVFSRHQRLHVARIFISVALSISTRFVAQLNTTNPTTVDDYNAIKVLAAAQADAADAQARLLTSQRALAAAQTQDPSAVQLTAATATANLAAQQKALADSQAGIVKGNFTVPESGFTGSITAGDKAGTIEASLLAAGALNIAAAHIAKDVKATGTIILYTTSQVPDFQALISFRAQRTSTDALLQSAADKLDQVMPKAAPLLPAVHEAAFPSMVGAAFDAANKLLGYFRTDYTIQGITLTPDDVLLINALSSKLSGKATVLVPATYNAAALGTEVPILTQLKSMASMRIEVQQKADVASGLVTALDKAAATEADGAKKQQEISVSAELKTAADQAKIALTLYDGLMAKITTPDDKAQVPLTAIIQQDAVQTALAGGARLMTAKVSTVGGSYYTRKNLWSFFGCMPFFTMGGVVVSYNILDGKTGAVLSAGVVPIDGGYYKVGKLPAKFSGEPEKTPNGANDRN